MSATAKIAEGRLADIVGEGNVSFAQADLAEYRVGGVTPDGVARPGSAAEIAELVKMAGVERLGVIACGARTKLEMGLPPAKYDLAIDMRRLDRITAYDPGDLTLAVDAGCALAKLQAALAEHRQFLPLLVPYYRQTSIGGTIASGVDSPLRQLYGTVRDYILGMEFVTGEGVAAKSGGRVVKNVTGYDLHKLMIGSLGTLGIITRINFRTFPLPTATRAFVAHFRDAKGAFAMCDRVAESRLAPSTIEVFSPQVAELFASDAAARLVPEALAPGLLPAGRWSFTCGFAGTDAVLARFESELRAMAERCGAAGMIVPEHSQIAGAFGRKREFVPIALEASPATVILKMSVLPRRISEALGRAAEIAEQESMRWAAMARGLGVIYLALIPARDDDGRNRVSRVCERVMSEIERVDGHATIPWCPAEWKSALPVWGRARADFPQMAKIKSVFDRNKILAPGRFVGGL